MSKEFTLREVTQKGFLSLFSVGSKVGLFAAIMNRFHKFTTFLTVPLMAIGYNENKKAFSKLLDNINFNHQNHVKT